MQDITFVWKGKEFRIEAREVLNLIAKIEDVMTLAELVESQNRKSAPLAKISKAYGMALRYAGAVVSDDDVYSGMFAKGEGYKAAMDAVTLLLMLMVPPEHLQEKDGGKSKKKAETPGVSLSKRHTKPD